MSNSNLTTKMLAAWHSKDIDAILEFFTDDAVYTNISLGPPNKGKSQIRAFLEGFMESVSELECTVYHQVEGLNGVVMHERSDRIEFHGKRKLLVLPVMGVFEFRAGKICAWRDYFDMKLVNESKN